MICSERPPLEASLVVILSVTGTLLPLDARRCTTPPDLQLVGLGRLFKSCSTVDTALFLHKLTRRATVALSCSYCCDLDWVSVAYQLCCLMQAKLTLLSHKMRPFCHVFVLF